MSIQSARAEQGLKGKAFFKYGLHIAVIAGAIWAGLKYIDGKEFASAMDEFNWVYAPFIALLGVGSLIIKAWRFATLLKKTTEIDRLVAMKAYIAGQSMTLLPGGIAARSALLNQVCVDVGDSGSAVAMSSITDQLGFLLCAIVAALWFEQARQPTLILLGILAVISILLGIEAVRVWLGKVIEWILGKLNLLQHWGDFKEAMKKTTKPKVVAVGVANALMAFALLVLALHLCMLAVGHSLQPMTLLLAFALPTMLGRISALPGGFGVTEVGIVTILDQAPNVRLAEAAAAVLVFRLGTVVFTAICGALVYAFSWRKEREAVDSCPVARS